MPVFRDSRCECLGIRAVPVLISIQPSKISRQSSPNVQYHLVLDQTILVTVAPRFAYVAYHEPAAIPQHNRHCDFCTKQTLLYEHSYIPKDVQRSLYVRRSTAPDHTQYLQTYHQCTCHSETWNTLYSLLSSTSIHRTLHDNHHSNPSVAKLPPTSLHLNNTSQHVPYSTTPLNIPCPSLPNPSST